MKKTDDHRPDIEPGDFYQGLQTFLIEFASAQFYPYSVKRLRNWLPIPEQR